MSKLLNEKNQSRREKALESLTEEEREAYDKWAEEEGTKLGDKRIPELFQLFLKGLELKAIAEDQSMPLGILAHAKVDFAWEEQREIYFQEMHKTVKQMAQKVALEAIAFTADAMSVYHKLAGEKFKRYLKTGDETELGELKNMSARTYKEYVELFQKVTGQANVSKKEISGEINYVMTDNTKVVEEVKPKPLSAKEASLLLDEMLKNDDNK